MKLIFTATKGDYQLASFAFNDEGAIPHVGDLATVPCLANSGNNQFVIVEQRSFQYSASGELHAVQLFCRLQEKQK